METEYKWVHLKDCSAIGDYEVTVERHKHNWKCEERYTDAWKWYVVYGGAVIAEGFSDDIDSAKESAVSSVPIAAKENSDPSGACEQ